MKHVYDMSFAEFQIRLFAWKRTEERQWEKVRVLAYQIAAGSIHRKDAMPPITQFMKLDLDSDKSIVVTEAHKDAYMKAVKNYLKEKEQWQA